MYRLLIADDEDLERRVTRMTISRSGLQFGEIYEAQNGREAIEIADAKGPQIILMDIRMPGINGIEAIREIKKSCPEAYIIITTAYDYFSYAREAFDLDVKDYLLKPVKKQVLIDKLKEAQEYFDKKKVERMQELELKEQISTLMPILENELCYFIIYDDIRNIEYSRYLEILSLKMDSGYAVVVNIKNKKDGSIINDFDKNYMKKKVYECIRESAKGCGKCIMSHLVSSNITLFFEVPRNEDKYNVRVNAINRGRKIADLVKEKTGMSTAIGIGECYESIENLKKSYGEALIALKYENIPMRVRHFSDISPLDLSHFNNSIENEKLLSDKIAEGNLQDSLYYFNILINSFTDIYGENMRGIRNVVLQLMLTIIIAAQNIGMDTDLKELIGIKDDIYLRNIDTVENLRFWGEQKITEIIDKIKRKSIENENDIVKKAKDYIDKHYCDHITLEELATHISVSPYYLSKIFKEDVGENFTDYVTNLRLAKAKELLLESDVSVKEICYSVGYSDPNYFSRVFKKCEGCSPSEYKELAK